MSKPSGVWTVLGVATLWLTMVGPTVAGAPAPPALPKVFLETSLASTPVTGKTIDVAAGGDFQAALNAAQPGDEIVLAAGATYTGNFLLPHKSDNGIQSDRWITIRSSNPAGLPKETVRVSPQHAAAMPKIVDPNEGNTFENNWTHAQTGTAILFTVRNQDGKAPWSAVQDVTMIHNVVRNANVGFVVMGFDTFVPGNYMASA